jgi:hypothetical protein
MTRLPPTGGADARRTLPTIAAAGSQSSELPPMRNNFRGRPIFGPRSPSCRLSAKVVHIALVSHHGALRESLAQVEGSAADPSMSWAAAVVRQVGIFPAIQEANLELGREILAEGWANALNLPLGNAETQLRLIVFANCTTIELGIENECGYIRRNPSVN